MCASQSHETVNRLTEAESAEPSWRGNLAKKEGREGEGGDRYKAEEEEEEVEEEEWAVEVVVY